MMGQGLAAMTLRAARLPSFNAPIEIGPLSGSQCRAGPSRDCFPIKRVGLLATLDTTDVVARSLAMFPDGFDTNKSIFWPLIVSSFDWSCHKPPKIVRKKTPQIIFQGNSWSRECNLEHKRAKSIGVIQNTLSTSRHGQTPGNPTVAHRFVGRPPGPTSSHTPPFCCLVFLR